MKISFPVPIIMLMPLVIPTLRTVLCIVVGLAAQEAAMLRLHLCFVVTLSSSLPIVPIAPIFLRGALTDEVTILAAIVTRATSWLLISVSGIAAISVMSAASVVPVISAVPVVPVFSAVPAVLGSIATPC